MNKENIRNFVLASIISAIIAVMTIVPYLGYISYGLIEITTLHIVVIIGSVLMGWKYGALLGGVWGLTCVIRASVLAAASPVFEIFINPFVSLVPRIIVGIVAGSMFNLLKNKLKVGDGISAGISAIAGTLTNTLLVLSSMYFFGGMISSYKDVFELLKTIWLTIIGVNGLIELIMAIIVVPGIYTSVKKVYRG